ncbi:MAG: nucleotidyl transferase AbiEii/AbiGii toxin family protein [Candidatus Omnitrophota bacterium]
MFTETLSKETKDALILLGKTAFFDKAYLAGGTACALQLGHRISVDLDFFTPEEFDTSVLADGLRKAVGFKLEQQRWATLLGTINEAKFSIFYYKYPVLFGSNPLFNINILDLRDIAAMKIDAISTRGIKRDFIDLYFLCQSGISLKDMLLFYDRKYGTLASNIIHIQKSLVYFIDADVSIMPRMLKKISWEEVKKYFEAEVRKMAKKI